MFFFPCMYTTKAFFLTDFKKNNIFCCQMFLAVADLRNLRARSNWPCVMQSGSFELVRGTHLVILMVTEHGYASC